MDQNGSIRVLLKKKDVQQQMTQHKKQQTGGKWTKESHGALKFCGWSMDGIKWFNELCMIVKTNRELCPHFDSTFLKNARDEKPEEHIAKKTNTIIVYDDMDRITKIAV